MSVSVRRSSAPRGTQQESADSGSSEDDITRMLIVVVLVFVVCQTPALITQLLIALLSQDAKTCPSPFFFYERISDLLVVANSSVNFIIYCFCSSTFRQIVVAVLCRRDVPIPPGFAPPRASVCRASFAAAAATRSRLQVNNTRHGSTSYITMQPVTKSTNV